MPHFLYNRTTHRTVAVCRADIEPDALLPSSEDSVSIQLQWEAILAGHTLKSIPLPPGAYEEALRLFHGYDPAAKDPDKQDLILQMHRWDAKAMDRARARREQARKVTERRRKRGVSEATKVEIAERHGRGQKVAYIAQKVDLHADTVRRVIKQSLGAENATPQPA